MIGFYRTIICLLGWLNIVLGLRQLAFSGGGAFGALEIGILKRIQEIDSNVYDYRHSAYDHRHSAYDYRHSAYDYRHSAYDLYTGISAGGLNAGFLSFFADISEGIRRIETLYGAFKNRQIYTLLPTTGLSIYNTAPLEQTIRDVVERMPNTPAVHTLIGTTNLYTGRLDVFTFSELNTEDQISLLMSTSAIPVVFPPIKFAGALYADGGTLSNELLSILTPKDHSYINITYITTSDSTSNSPIKIDSIKDMVKRTLQIVLNNYNDPLATLNQDCASPVGEINQWFVNATYLSGYDELDFEYGQELVKIGYTYAEHKTYKIC